MGAMTFEEWCSYKKMVMGETPAWFDDPAERRRRFEAYRAAFEENCSAANPLDAAFAPVADLPLDVAPVTAPSAAQIGSGASYLASIRAAALALLVQIMLFAAPAFAGGNVLVNGDVLAAQDRVSLEAVVGPLEPGRYWVSDNGEFGREGADIPIANLRLLIQQRIQAAQTPWQAQQQYALRQQLKLAARILQNATRQRQDAPNRYRDGYNFSGGGTANGCIYAPTWSNC